MCNRYSLPNPDSALAEISRILGVMLAKPSWVTPRYNVTPRTVVPAIVDRGQGPELMPLQWGFLPPRRRSQVLLNARSETALSKPSFAAAARDHRCVLVANGFYDFFDDEGRKRPFLFTQRHERPLAMAGLWDPGDDQEAIPPTTCIVTADPNTLVAEVHDRMPILLRDEHVRRWLEPSPLPPEEFKAMTTPLPAEAMCSREVSDYVNHVRHEGPECHAPPKPRPQQLGFAW